MLVFKNELIYFLFYYLNEKNQFAENEHKGALNTSLLEFSIIRIMLNPKPANLFKLHRQNNITSERQRREKKNFHFHFHGRGGKKTIECQSQFKV